MPHDTEAVELMAYQGGAIKAVGDDGTFEGYLIVWGSSDQTDVSSQRDYFTPDTYLGRLVKSGMMDVYYNHGLSEVAGVKNAFAHTVIGETTEAKFDDFGLWVKGQVDISKEYNRRFYAEGVKPGKMGLSSGAVSHLVGRTQQPNGSHKVDAWPVYEASITATPAEPRARIIHSVKSLMQITPDAPASWVSDVESVIGQASELIAVGRRFPHLPDVKRAALKSLRSHLDELLRMHDPIDPAREAEARRVAEMLSTRFGS